MAVRMRTAITRPYMARFRQGTSLLRGTRGHFYFALTGGPWAYICGQSDIIIDYATARHQDEPISTAVTERTCTVAVAPANERTAAHALVTTRRSSDAEGSDRERQWDA